MSPQLLLCKFPHYLNPQTTSFPLHPSRNTLHHQHHRHHRRQKIATPYGANLGHHHNSTLPIQMTAISIPHVRRPPRAIVTRTGRKYPPPKSKSTPISVTHRVSRTHGGPVWTARTRMDTPITRCCRSPYELEGLCREHPMAQGRRIRRPNPSLGLELRMGVAAQVGAGSRRSIIRSFYAASTPKGIVREIMASTPARVGRSEISSNSNSNSIQLPMLRQSLRVGGPCIRRGAWTARCASSLRSTGSGPPCNLHLAVVLEEEQRYRLEQACHGTRPLRASVHSQCTVHM